MNLNEQIDTVQDEITFLKFVDALRHDRKQDVSNQKKTPIDDCGLGPVGWENHTIEDFLEAAHAWAEDSDFGSSQGLEDANPWKKFAVFLYCGKIYE